MSRLSDWWAERGEWAEYRGQLKDMDRDLGTKQPGTPEFDDAWHDRMGYAANKYAGAPAPDRSDPAEQKEAGG